MVAYACQSDPYASTASFCLETVDYDGITGGDYYLWTTTVTDDPWVRVDTCSDTTRVDLPPKPKVDWSWLLYEQHRAASMVLPEPENRAQTRPQLRARHGYQQMYRLPCYRGVRTR